MTAVIGAYFLETADHLRMRKGLSYALLFHSSPLPRRALATNFTVRKSCAVINTAKHRLSDN